MHDGHPPPVLKKTEPRVSARFVANVAHDPHDPCEEAARMDRKNTPPMSTAWIAALAMGAIASLGALFAIGYLPQHRRQEILQQEAELVKNAPLRVSVVKPTKSHDQSDMLLPGEIQAVRETTIYARTSGYIKKWTVDMGDNVQTGQLLAEIDSPEIDMQLQRAQASLEQTQATAAQSQADLEQAKTAIEQSEAALAQAKALLANAQANAELADLTTKRYTSLRGTGGVTEQDISDKETAAKVAHTVVAANEAGVGSAKAALNHSHAAVLAAEASLKAAQANINVSKAEVAQSQVMKSFERVTAPFDGKITARLIETGALVTAGSSTTGQALFRLSCSNPVRVFVNVPQTQSRFVSVGQSIDVFLREAPGKKYTGKVTRTAGSIDTATRTLRTEIEVPNPDGSLLSGMYAQAQFSLKNAGAPLLIPGSALVVNAEGTQVAVVKDGHAHFQKVTIDSDHGGTFGVVSGLSEEDSVIANPGERLSEGVAVEAISAAAGK